MKILGPDLHTQMLINQIHLEQKSLALQEHLNQSLAIRLTRERLGAIAQEAGQVLPEEDDDDTPRREL